MVCLALSGFVKTFSSSCCRYTPLFETESCSDGVSTPGRLARLQYGCHSASVSQSFPYLGLGRHLSSCLESLIVRDESDSLGGRVKTGSLFNTGLSVDIQRKAQHECP